VNELRRLAAPIVVLTVLLGIDIVFRPIPFGFAFRAWLVALGALTAAALVRDEDELRRLQTALIENVVREVGLVAVMLVVGGAILWLAERVGARQKVALDLSFAQALAIGAAQAIALVPGISRSGISISAGLFAGLRREEAARFSFLMATPITAAAAAYEVLKVVRGEGVPIQVVPMVAGLLMSLVFGVLAIAVLLRFLRTRSTDVFVAYRVILAAAVLIIWLS